ncbi:MAG TPA: lamin tail domain-containing protein [Methanothrix sp.]|nr:lamin tail domain-containing protein [Methanothrix sp.]HPT36989.1 lamin tail domain-containing protein [Methanothrix sp.]
MKNRLFAGALIALALLFMGAALVQGADESGIAITSVNFAATSPEKDNLNEEWVEISNLGSADASLTGWTLEDAQNHSYSFPDISLKAGAAIKIHTGTGTDTEEDLYWNRSSSIWNNDGDVATLMDASGNTIAKYPEEA